MAPTMYESVAENDDTPSQFGRYEVVRELGRGGMARVFEGRHVELGSRVALKVMQRVLAAERLAAARFLQEAKTASKLRHPNVVQVFDIGCQDGLPFIVMELLEGVDLATWLDEKGALPIGTIVDLFLPVISAMARAHAAGIVHRDLKPANVMITHRPPHVAHPVLLDFGISKIANREHETTFTRSDSLLGTLHYMAPELTRGAKFATASSDQYALGLMLYECATGRRPFTGNGQYELMHAIVTAPVPPPSAVRPGIPAEFDALVEKAMRRNPAERFPSVSELGSALLSFGDRTAWKLWKSEFMVQSRASDVSSAQRTLPDSRLPPRGHENAVTLNPPAPGGRHSPWMLAALGLYALLMTLLAWRKPWGTPSEVVTSPVPAPPPATTTSSGAEPVGTSSLVYTDGERQSPTAIDEPASSRPISVPTLRPSRVRSTESPRPSGSVASAVPPAASVEPRPAMRGSNGALIVE